MYRIVKTGYIDMAHRIRGHKGKCRFLHGHTWKIELSVSCEDGHLDELGMVVDFAVLKDEFFAEVDKRFDHSCVLGEGDQSLPVRTRRELNIHSPVPGNLTAETLARMFFTLASINLGREYSRVKVDYVRVYEQLRPTESYAEYRPTRET